MSLDTRKVINLILSRLSKLTVVLHKIIPIDCATACANTARGALRPIILVNANPVFWDHVRSSHFQTVELRSNLKNRVGVVGILMESFNVRDQLFDPNQVTCSGPLNDLS